MWCLAGKWDHAQGSRLILRVVDAGCSHQATEEGVSQLGTCSLHDVQNGGLAALGMG